MSLQNIFHSAHSTQLSESELYLAVPLRVQLINYTSTTTMLHSMFNTLEALDECGLNMAIYSGREPGGKGGLEPLHFLKWGFG